MIEKHVNHGGLAYEAPFARVLDIVSEGVFCNSPEYDTADYGYGTNLMEGL